MTIEVSRRHWVVSAVLVAMQIPGYLIMAKRGQLVMHGWIHLGFVAVPNDWFGWILAVEALLCIAFVTSLILVRLWDVAFRNSVHRTRDLVLLVLAALSGGVALWHFVLR